MQYDLSAFDPAPEAHIDADGFLISDTWQPRPDKWEKLPYKTRQGLSEAYTARLAKEAAKKPKTYRPGAKRFTTDYAIEWGRKQGWKLVEREGYDFRTQRHHDTMLGTDAIFDDGDGLVGIQGAGKGEKTPHYQRFIERGGPEKAKRRSIRIFYVEFVRGNKTPILTEQWA